MQFTIVSILALATAALSMPAGQEKRDDHARADLCTSSHHGGYCINFGLLPYGKSHCCRKIHPFFASATTHTLGTGNFKDDFYQFNDALSSIYPSDGATWTLYA
jgi:hypothetical protein